MMGWSFYILFLTYSHSLESLPTSGDGESCSDGNPELNLMEDSAAFYFTRDDDAAIKCLQKELEKDPEFERLWNLGRANWTLKNLPVPKGLREEHMIAVTGFTMNSNLYRRLNTGVKNYGDIDTYNSHFKLKSFHYLLTIALINLRKGSRHLTVYRGEKIPLSGRKDTEMRFGRFASTSHNQKVAEGFGKATFFVVTTSYGVTIRDYSVNRSQEEVLIPPYEKFKITKFTQLQGGGCNFTLQSTDYQGVKVMLQENCTLTPWKMPWWGWFLITVAIVAVLVIAGVLCRCCCS
ncbi:ecto-ADP-ribosyltransferase 5-like [Heterodontus francisci]|uniref:ecto-ADP-ribosyltransferase 5-like n=1 Tax=Heterodontus francisci TaxID=7792 RepID=UPI00355BEA03